MMTGNEESLLCSTRCPLTPKTAICCVFCMVLIKSAVSQYVKVNTNQGFLSLDTNLYFDPQPGSIFDYTGPASGTVALRKRGTAERGAVFFMSGRGRKNVGKRCVISRVFSIKKAVVGNREAFCTAV